MVERFRHVDDRNIQKPTSFLTGTFQETTLAKGGHVAIGKIRVLGDHTWLVDRSKLYYDANV